MPFELRGSVEARVVDLSGVLSGEDFRSLAGELDGARSVILDLCGASVSGDEVQDAAVALAKRLSASACRVAWVANVPRVRGWASLVAYQGGDDLQMRTVSNMAAAERWLASSEDALEARKSAVLRSEKLLGR